MALSLIIAFVFFVVFFLLHNPRYLRLSPSSSRSEFSISSRACSAASCCDGFDCWVSPQSMGHWRWSCTGNTHSTHTHTHNCTKPICPNVVIHPRKRLSDYITWLFKCNYTLSYILILCKSKSHMKCWGSTFLSYLITRLHCWTCLVVDLLPN